MTIKELKNNLLLSLYKRYKENELSSIRLTFLCKEDGIVYDSLHQLSSAAHSLKDTGYIEATFFVGGDALIGLTADGMEYVEDNLLSQEELVLDGLQDTEKMVANGTLKFDDVSQDQQSVEPPNSIGYTPQEIVKPIKDQDVAPCFSVDDVADCFIKQLDKIAESNSENTPMIGLFGPWGRGKSYFLKRIFKKLGEREQERVQNNKIKKYKVIEFNAWKHQDTPAIWAYLYETIYRQTGWVQQAYIKFQLWKKTVSIPLFIIVFIISYILCYYLDFYTNFLNHIRGFCTLEIASVIIATITTFLTSLKDNPIAAYKIIQKYAQHKTYNEYLGIQNEIEKDLETVLEALTICQKDKVLLCIDDIDRCPTEKMINIVDSLRTVLENERIREKLIVICCIDVNKLMMGYRMMYKSCGFEGEYDKLSREQIDKLFIFGMGLAPLGKSQLKEYLGEIISTEVSNHRVSVSTSKTFFDTDRQESVLYVTEVDAESKQLTDAEIYRIISQFINKNDIGNITPRKLRIMYYQLLFANNLASKQGVTLLEDLIMDLLYKSLTGIDNNSPNKALGDIVDMAVPY